MVQASRHQTFLCYNRGDMDLSAICEYQLEQIQQVFEGPYKEYSEQAQKWARYTDPVPSPRPGSVSFWHGGVLPTSAAPGPIRSPC